MPRTLPLGAVQGWNSVRRRLSGFTPIARPLPLVLLVAVALRLSMTPDAPVPETRDLSLALAETLRAQQLESDPREMHWLEPAAGAAGSNTPSVVFRAQQGDAPADIYRAQVRLSPGGRLLEVQQLYNLTETSAVDEQQLVVAENLAAWAIEGGGKYYSIHLADFSGQPLPQGKEWTWLKRMQQRLTNLQSTGDALGIGRRSFKLDPSPSELVIGFKGRDLLVAADSHHFRIGSDAQPQNPEFVTEQKHHLSRPGNLITWAVDRVRQTSWFGRDKMQWIKAIGFAGLDYAERVVGSVTGSDGSEQIAEELGELAKIKPVEYTDPETGWPPPSMTPLLKPALEGEGKWVSLEDDPYIKKNPGAPSPFVFSFIRTDRERAFSQTYVVMWDPRQVELHAASGTQEPKTATGETGDGLVPRRVGVIDRMLAGFNGGFQATHGEFGMMAEGVMYLPPKPYSATVAKLSDGWTAFGTWSESEQVPDDVVSFRQNMTPLIQDGKVNPYKRSWWGGTPPGWEDESRTIRSALCLTREGFVAYIYGSSLDADHLIRAAELARCDYAIHLDMNPGHTGLEFYHVAPAGQLPRAEGKLNPVWQARGPVPDMPGWEYVGRRMIKYMALMNFPRYITRESRDFFYLTLRHILPGAPIPEHLARAGNWRTKGLPQRGWPLAIATAALSPDPERPGTQLELVKLDARMLKPSREAVPPDATVISFPQPERVGRGSTLWWTARGFEIAAADDKELQQLNARGLATPVAIGHAPSEALGKVVLAGVGLDAGRMAIYVEIMSGHQRATDARMMSSVLSELGCSEVLLFERVLTPAVGGARTLDGRAARTDQLGLHFVRAAAPAARRFLKDTRIVPPDVWAPLQRKRVRYFRKPSTENAERALEPAPAPPTAAGAPQ